MIVSAGLFDYLDEKTAFKLLSHLATLLEDDGVLAVTNYSTEDKSAFVKEWIGDWNLIFRNENDMRRIFPNPNSLSLSFSSNRSLLLAKYRNSIREKEC